MSVEKYYIGLDIGTASVGWAVTDTDLNLIKVKKQNFWGTRKFDGGNTAEERRTFRSTRRRLNRRKQRISLLQDFFIEELIKVDPDFYIKLNKSWVSDKDEERVKGADFVFNKKQRKDKELYYSKFPTIWHLRKKLIENKHSKVDIRWVYLAIHHILKYRGNFLYTDAEFKQTDAAIEDQFERLIDYLEENYEVEIIRDEFIETIKDVLSDTSMTTTAKRDYLRKELGKYKSVRRQMTQFTNAILGYSTNYNTLFNFNGKNTKGYIQDGFDNDENYGELRAHLGLDEDILEVLSQIYSWGVLRKLLPDENNQFISYEMVNQYEEYGQDLKDLKGLFDEYSTQKNKNEFFKSPKIKNNYYNYNLSKKDVPLENLYKTINKLLPETPKIVKDERYQRYLKRNADFTFLKVQNTTDKGSVPHQLHRIELEKIIENQSKFYPFLETEKDKLISILTFRIPYYVGPLNDKSEFSWLTRTDEKIYPWNFDAVVDREASEEEFIHRMIGNCSYLTEEDALPLESLTYQEYIVLNELNTVRVNTDKLDIVTKQAAIEELFKTNNNVTIRKFQNWLEKYWGENNTYKISGLSHETKFNGSMSSWNKFTKIGIDLTNPENYEMAEEIILWASIFSDKETLRTRIQREYPELTESQLRSIVQWNFKGWGRLSYTLLNGLRFELPTGEITTILERMRNTDDHFMQIINNKEEGFSAQLQEVMIKENTENSILEQIQELPGSPAIKKGIHQAVLLVKEITKIMGSEPKKIFLEFAREDGEKIRTSSRYKQLDEIYKKIANENSKMFNPTANEHFKEVTKNQKELDEEKIFLYFLQNGKCLYSGREIDWQRLNSSDYEVDHILPQSYTKDDSISNKALVYRDENQRKQDDLLLKEDIIEKNKYFWSFLKDKRLISEKKYFNLTRDHLTVNTQKGFINRQLVETRQISKHVKNLLINIYPDTKVQTLKAQFNSDYRKRQKLYKIRGLNDFHHAHDAYLSMFLGEFIDRRLPWVNNYDPVNREKYDKKIKKMYKDRQTFNKKNKYGLINLIFKDSEKNNWQADKQNEKAKKYLDYKDCFVTYKPEKRTGEFYNQNILPVLDRKKNKVNKNLIPIKNNVDSSIYGGYSGQNTAYFALVRVGKKIKPVPIPIQISKQIESKTITMLEYIEKIEPKGKILREQVLVNTLFEYNNHPFITKSHRERINGKQLIVPKALHKLLYSVEQGFDYQEKRMDFENYLNVLLTKLEKQFSSLGNSSGLIRMIEDNYSSLLEIKNEEVNHFIEESLFYFNVNSIYPSFKIESITDFKNKNRFGRMNGFISNWKDIVIVDQSITGYYESRLKL